MAGESTGTSLSLIRAAMSDWDKELQRLNEKDKELCSRVKAGGVKLVVIFLRAFDVKVNPVSGKKPFSRSFKVRLLHARGAEPLDSKAFEGTRSENEIRVSASYSPKSGAPLPPASLGDPPTAVSLYTGQSVTMSTSNKDILDKIPSQQIVILKGVTARAWLAGLDGPMPSWGISYDASAIEDTGFSASDLWPAAAGKGTDILYANTQRFDPSDKKTRYNYDQEFFVSVRAKVRPDDEESQEQRAHRWMRECSETMLDVKNCTPKTWASEAQEGTERNMRALLTLNHIQWPHGTAYDKDNVQEVLIKINLYEEYLKAFGFGTNVEAWESMAQMIFSKLNFKAVGFVDADGSESNFGGVEGDKKVDFALQLIATAVIPDLETCYREVGIPVNKEFVLEQLGASSSASNTNADIFDTLRPVVPITGSGADPRIARALATMDNPPEFRALIPYTQTRSVFKGIASLNPDEGAALVSTLLTGRTQGIADNKKVMKLYENMATDDVLQHCFIFALTDKIIPDNIKSAKFVKLRNWMLGQAKGGAPAIENGSASASAPAPASASATIEEVDEEEEMEEAEEVEEEEEAEEAEEPSRKRKKSKKSKDGASKKRQRKEE